MAKTDLAPAPTQQGQQPPQSAPPSKRSRAQKALNDFKAGKLDLAPAEVQRLEGMLRGSGGAPQAAPQSQPPAQQQAPAGPPQAGQQPTPQGGGQKFDVEFGEEPVFYNMGPQADPMTSTLAEAQPVEPRDINRALYEMHWAMNKGPGDFDPIDASDRLSVQRARERNKKALNDQGVAEYPCASGESAICAPPVAGARGDNDETKSRSIGIPGITPVFTASSEQNEDFLYYEPTDGEFEAVYAGAKEKALAEGKEHLATSFQNALDSFEKLGRESKAYQRYADLKWREVARIADELGEQRAIRVDYAPESETAGTMGQVSRAPMAGTATGILDSFTFGVGGAALDWFTSQADTPIGRGMKEFGIAPTGVFDSTSDEASWYEYGPGALLGMLGPGPAKATYQGLGKLANSAKSRLGRAAANAAMDFGMDVSTSGVRQILEAAATGADLDFKRMAAQAGVEGAVGMGMGGAMQQVAESGGAFARKLERTDVEGRQREIAGFPTRSAERTKNVLNRDVGDILSGRRPEADEVQIAAERYVDARPKTGDKTHVGAMSQGAAEHVASDIQPRVAKKVGDLSSQLDDLDDAYIKKFGTVNMHPLPVKRAFRSMWDYYQSVTDSSPEVSRRAVRALEQVAEPVYMNESAARAARARGEIVVPIDDPLVGKLSSDSRVAADKAYKAAYDEATAGAYTPQDVRSRERRALVQADQAGVEWNRANPSLSPSDLTPAQGMRVRPAGPSGPARSVDEPDIPSAITPLPVGAMDDTLEASLSPSLTKQAMDAPTHVVLRPRKMTTKGYISARRAAADAISYGSQNETGREAAQKLDKAMRDSAAEFPQMQYHLDRTRPIIEELERATKFVGENRRTLGNADSPEGRSALVNALREKVYQDPHGPSTERFVAFLDDNPRVIGLLRGIRAVVAAEKMSDTTSHIRTGVGGGGPYAYAPNALSLFRDLKYRAGKRLDNARRSGDLDVHLRAILSPASRRFIADLDDKEFEQLYDAFSQAKQWLPGGGDEDTQEAR